MTKIQAKRTPRVDARYHQPDLSLLQRGAVLQWRPAFFAEQPVCEQAANILLRSDNLLFLRSHQHLPGDTPTLSDRCSLILITGAAGFIGLHVTQALFARRHAVVGMAATDA